RLASDRRQAIANLDARLSARSPRELLTQAQQHTNRLEEGLKRAAKETVQRQGRTLDSAVRTLQALNPLSVMDRGYSLVRSGDRVIKSAGELDAGDKVSISFRD